MKKGSILLAFFSFMLMQSEAQIFTKVMFDSTGSGLLGCIIDDAGGYVFAGGHAPNDNFIMKTTSGGQPVWMKQFLDSEGPLTSGIKTNDGGFAFTGHTYIEYYNIIALSFLKTDSLGNLQKASDYWVDDQNDNHGFQLLQDASDTFYLLNDGAYSGDPYSNECFSIMKLDSAGNYLSQKNFCSYFDNGHPEARSFMRTTDGGFIISGTFSGNSIYKFFLVKTDSLLNTQWYKVFGDQSDISFRTVVQQKPNGHYLVVGSISGFTTLYTMVAELTDTGSVVWSKTYEATGRSFFATGFVQNADGSITLCGFLDTPGARVIIMNIDSTGNLNWSKLLLTSADDEYAWDFKATPDGGFIFCGIRLENGNGYAQFTKTDFDGNTKCSDTAFSLIVSDPAFTSESHSMEEINGGISGNDWFFSEMNFDSLSDLCLATVIHEVKNTESVSLFPDPASDMITIIFPGQLNLRSDISIFDATGKLVRSFINVHSSQLEIPVAEIGIDGLYFYRVIANDKQIFSGKFLIQR